MATPPYDGVFMEYVAYPADMTFKLPENMGTLEGAFIEPLAVGLHATKQGGASIGKTAMIFGSGCIGLMTMLSLKAMGVSQRYISDLLPKRLEMAKRLGVTAALNGNELI